VEEIAFQHDWPVLVFVVGEPLTMAKMAAPLYSTKVETGCARRI
jgi:hypothetical protein